MPEQSTIRRFIKGDIDAFEAIYGAYYPKAVYFAIKYVCSEAVAKDLVQDVFLSLWEARENLNPEKSVEPYIMVSVKNKCLNYLRDTLSELKATESLQKRMLKLNYDALQNFSNSTFDAVATKNLRDKMTESLSKLPGKTREAFMMNRFNDLSYKQIAERQGVSERNVEYRINCALRKLKKDLKEFICRDF